MPTKIEKDALSGHDTTGHEWDGVKELNTPLPTWWVYTFYATIVFAVVYCVLYPSWPWLNGHTNGFLGYSSRAELTQSLDDQAQRAARSSTASAPPRWPTSARIPSCSTSPLAGGRSAFQTNCMQCHGAGGAGSTRLSQSRRRRLDVGRQHRPDPHRPSSTASAIPTTSRARH